MRDPGEAARRVDQPEPGHFELRLVKGGFFVPARILHVDGQWSASIAGRSCGPSHADPVHADGVFRIWLSGRRCSEANYEFRLALCDWARDHAPDHPVLHPERPIDLHSLPVVF